MLVILWRSAMHYISLFTGRDSPNILGFFLCDYKYLEGVMKRFVAISAAIFVTMLLTGCGTMNRVGTNFTSLTGNEPTLSADTKVIISEDSLPGRRYRVIGPVEVSVKKLSILNKDPTKEQANDALAEWARNNGADAVINVKYSSGIGLWTWGYFDADGTGVRLIDWVR